MTMQEQLWKLCSGYSGFYPYQLKLLQPHDKPRIINKSRQLGITSFYAFRSLIRALKGKRTIFISPAERQSLNAFNYSLKYLNKLRPHLDHDPVKILQSGYYKLDTGGSVLCLPNSPSTVRGFNVEEGGDVIFDEFAHFERPEEIWEAVYPMIIRGGELDAISTPYGEGNLYARDWFEAEKYGFEKVLINWRECDDMPEEKAAKIRKTMDELSWRQEFENEFIGSVLSYFHMDLIKSCVDKSLSWTDSPETLSKADKLIFGVDIGRTRDKTAIVGINAKSQVKFKTTLDKMPFKQQEDYLSLLAPFASLMKIDQNGIGMELSENLTTKHGSIIEPLSVTNELKLNNFICLHKLMEEKKITLPDDYELQRALNMIERKQVGTTISFDAPRTDETGHSDVAMALMFCMEPRGREWSVATKGL